MASSISFSGNNSSPSSIVYPIGASFSYSQILLIDSRYEAVKNAALKESRNNALNIQPLLNNPLDNYLFWLPPSQPFLTPPLPADESIDLSINRNNASSISQEQVYFYLTVKPTPLEESAASAQIQNNPEAFTIQDLRQRPDHTIMYNLQPFCKICKLTQEPTTELIPHTCGCSNPSLSYIHRNCLIALIHEDAFYIPGISCPDTSLPSKNQTCPLCLEKYNYSEPIKKTSCRQRLCLAFLTIYSLFLTILLINQVLHPFSFSFTFDLSATFLAIYAALSYGLLLISVLKLSKCRCTRAKKRAHKKELKMNTARTPSSSSLMEVVTSPVKPCLSERIRQRKQMFQVARVKVVPYQ